MSIPITARHSRNSTVFCDHPVDHSPLRSSTSVNNVLSPKPIYSVTRGCARLSCFDFVLCASPAFFALRTHCEFGSIFSFRSRCPVRESCRPWPKVSGTPEPCTRRSAGLRIFLPILSSHARDGTMFLLAPASLNLQSTRSSPVARCARQNEPTMPFPPPLS